MPSKIGAAIKQTLAAANLEHGRIVLGVSGGPDSLALLAGAIEDRAMSGRDVVVAHFDHRLRPESGDDADFVHTICRQYDLAFRLGHGTRLTVGPKAPWASEDFARDARYAFFADVVSATGSAAVLVGHTAQDQTETRLLHLVRGSGLRGLRGMAADSRVNVRSGRSVRVLRPLLTCSREDTVAYCQATGLEPRIDPSNGDPSYARNRLRRQVVPELLKLNPGVDLALHRLGRIAADADDFLELELERRLPGLIRGEPGRWEIDRNAWRRLPRALKRTLVRRTAGSVRSRYDVGADAVEIVVESIDSGSTGTTLTLRNARIVRIDQDRAVIEDVGIPRPRVTPTTIALGENSETTLGPGLELDRPLGPTTWWQESALVLLRIKRQTAPCAGRLGDRRHADLDRAKLGNSGYLQVRSWHNGDVISPEGMTGRKKVQDIFVDAKISRETRGSMPILATPEGKIVWIVGLRRDRTVLAESTSTDVLCIEVAEVDQGKMTSCPV